MFTKSKDDEPQSLMEKVADRREVYMVALALLKQLGCTFYPIDVMALSDWLMNEDVLIEEVGPSDDEDGD